MADTRPTPVSFFRAVFLCILLLFSPKKFKVAEDADIKDRDSYTNTAEPISRALFIRKAFFRSFALIIAFGIAGYCTGLLAGEFVACASPNRIIWLQVVGACLLLWGTLFVRGWEIQSISGVTFSERVNQWLYRSLCCMGTFVLVWLLAWPQCT